MNGNQQIDLLLERLNWASDLSKERACSSIAELLINEHSAELVYQRLLKWLSGQLLESVCIYGLLALSRAIDRGMQLGVSGEEIWQAIRSPSILAWALTKELFPVSSIPPNNALIYTLETPREYKSGGFFDKFIHAYVPPIYALRAERLEQTHLFPFRRTWAYEWELLVQKTHTKLSDRPLHFWMGHREESDEYAYADSKISELYKSAYLRALAKMVDKGNMGFDDALSLATQDCPIDLELWNLEPTKKPDWWPALENGQAGDLDLTVAHIWRQIENIWAERASNDLGWIVHASGAITAQETVYDLEIFGLLQRAHGPAKPDLHEVAFWCKHDEPNMAKITCLSPFRFSGVQFPRYPDETIRAFNDWSFLSLAHFGKPHPIARWQAWRFWRNIWLPNSGLFADELTFRVKEEALGFENRGRQIATWRDWTDGIAERQNRRLPPQNGEYLTVDSQIVRDFMDYTGSNYCWLCALTRYYRKDEFSRYESFPDYRLFGGSSLILP